MNIDADGLSLYVEVHGDGPPVLLLHGFPDSGRLWRHQVPALVAAGHRVIVPDLRGFGRSARPPEVDAYQMPVILGDLDRVLTALDVGRAAVVGHDWGAGVAWALAALVPERVERLVAMSLGHPAGFFSDPLEQRERSWYFLFFQFACAEEALRRDDWRLLRLIGRGEGDVDQYLADLDRPGALTAALNWYRANAGPEAFGLENPMPLPPVRCPALGIWGARDPYLGEAQMAASQAHCLGGWRYERLEDAGHWFPLEAPDSVNRLLLEFLGSPAAFS
jgi:pimeloyl-ACP methyl ester carboxylesterase